MPEKKEKYNNEGIEKKERERRAKGEGKRPSTRGENSLRSWESGALLRCIKLMNGCLSAIGKDIIG